MPIALIEFGRVPHWHRPEIVCSCPRMWKRKKLGACPHLIRARGPKGKSASLSAHLRAIGVDSPFEIGATHAKKANSTRLRKPSNWRRVTYCG
jgi:hypothetical protein